MATYIKVYDLCGANCIAAKHATQLYEQIYPLLKAGKEVELDFAGAYRFLSIFFNIAIGQLFRDIPAADISRSLKFTNLDDLGQRVNAQVIESAKLYYSDDNYRKAVDIVNAEELLAYA
jgi:hypothetical protein